MEKFIQRFYKVMFTFEPFTNIYQQGIKHIRYNDLINKT